MCTGCDQPKGKYYSQQPKMQNAGLIANADTTSIKTFLISLGWVYVGNCGCHANLNKYSNEKYIGYQIWINQQATTMQVRQATIQARGTVIVASGGINNYITEYLKIFN